MKTARAFAVCALLAWPGTAFAQLQLTPQTKSTAKPAAKPATPAKKAEPKPASASTPQAANTTPANADTAYGAFQRGYFLTAFFEATKHAEAGKA